MRIVEDQHEWTGQDCVGVEISHRTVDQMSCAYFGERIRFPARTPIAAKAAVTAARNRCGLLWDASSETHAGRFVCANAQSVSSTVFPDPGPAARTVSGTSAAASSASSKRIREKLRAAGAAGWLVAGPGWRCSSPLALPFEPDAHVTFDQKRALAPIMTRGRTVRGATTADFIREVCERAVAGRS